MKRTAIIGQCKAATHGISGSVAESDAYVLRFIGHKMASLGIYFATQYGSVALCLHTFRTQIDGKHGECYRRIVLHQACESPHIILARSPIHFRNDSRLKLPAVRAAQFLPQAERIAVIEKFDIDIPTVYFRCAIYSDYAAPERYRVVELIIDSVRTDEYFLCGRRLCHCREMVKQ